MKRTWIQKSLLVILVVILGMFVLAGFGACSNSEEPEQEQTDTTGTDEEEAEEVEEAFDAGADENTRFIQNGNVQARIQVPEEGWKPWPPNPTEPKPSVTLYYSPDGGEVGDKSPQIILKINEKGASYPASDPKDLGMRNIGGFDLPGRSFIGLYDQPTVDYIGDITGEYIAYVYIRDLDIDDPEVKAIIDSIRFQVD